MYMKSILKTTLLAASIMVAFYSNANGTLPASFTTNVHNWLSNNIAYPIGADLSKQGTVYVSFSVNDKNEIENVYVAKGVSIELDNAAINYVKNMPVADLTNSAENIAGTYIVPIKFVIK